MPHLESKTKLIMTASVNWYINPQKNVAYGKKCELFLRIYIIFCTFAPQRSINAVDELLVGNSTYPNFHMK
jgi:hypothetical protein